MKKISTKKMLTVLITLAMVFSALAVLSLAAQPAYATASGTVSYTPTTVTAAQVGTTVYTQIGSTGVYTPIIAATGGTFGSGSTVYFYWSTSNSASGILYSSTPSVTTYAFSAVLGASQTTLTSNTVLTPNTGLSGWKTTDPAVTPGATLYLLASDTAFTSLPAPNVAQFAASVAFTVTSASPTVDLNGATSYTSEASGGQVAVTGSGFSAQATSATLYFNYDGSSQVLGTVSVVGGSVASDQYVTVPTNMPELASPGYYGIVAAANTGETADAALEITPAVTFTPNIVGFAAGQTFSIAGTGFMANGWIQLNNAFTSPTETNPAVQVSSDGSFTVSVTTTGALATAPAVNSITVNEYPTQTGGSSETSAIGYLYSSTPTYTGMTISLSATSIASTDTEVSGTTGVAFLALDFPASTTFELMVGPVAVESFTTNSFGGFAGTYTVPTNLPAGGYTVTGVNSAEGLYAQTTGTLTITESFSVSSLSPGYSYLPSGYLEGETGASTFALSGTGFVANLPIETGTSSASGDVVLNFGSSTLNGDFTIPSAAETNSTGSFNITVTVSAASGFTMNTPVTVKYSDNGGTFSTAVDVFDAYISPTLTVNTATTQLGAPYTASAHDYITVTSDTLLPSSSYELEFGTQVITTFTTDSSGSIVPKGVAPAPVPGNGVEFAVPSLPSGYYPINFVLSGTQIAIADPTASFFLITSPGSTPTVVIQDVGVYTPGVPAPAGLGVGSSASDVVRDTINIFAYNFPAGSSGFNFFSADSLFSKVAAGASTSTGAYYLGATIGTVPGGTYLVSAYATGISGTEVALPANAAMFTVIASLNHGKYSTTVGGTVSFLATGLAPNTNYVGVFNGQVLTSSGLPVTYTSDYTGSISSASFTVPPVYVSQTNGFSVYKFSLAPLSSPTTLVATSKVVVTYPTNIMLSPDPQAFPGELVSFTWTPATEPSLTPSSPYTAPINVTVYLDGSAYVTVPGTFNYNHITTADSYITGAFQMPNGMPGTNMSLSFGWSYTSTAPESVVVTNGWTSTETATVTSLGSTPGSLTPLPVTLDNTMFGSYTDISVVVPAGGVGSFPATTYPTDVSADFVVLVNTVAETTTPTITGSITYYVTGQYTVSGETLPFNIPVNTLTFSVSTPSTNTQYTETSHASGTYQSASTINSVSYGSYTGSSVASIELVQGNGALLTGISSGEIATITADVTNAVTTSMKVPLQELNASVVAINGAVAKINTAFGNMTATLSAINATVASISSGQVLVLTKLGSVETSLASLNASLMMVSGNVATINTTLGMVQTSLSSIGATVSSTATSVSGLVGSTATIKTDLGNISGQVTGVSNGVATIQTSIGKLNSTVSQIQLSAGQIKSSSSTLEIFLIVAIVLILITLVIAFLAVNNTNRLAKKFEEQKKQ
jgi:hypothetical protein